MPRAIDLGPTVDDWAANVPVRIIAKWWWSTADTGMVIDAKRVHPARIRTSDSKRLPPLSGVMVLVYIVGDLTWSMAHTAILRYPVAANDSMQAARSNRLWLPVEDIERILVR